MFAPDDAFLTTILRLLRSLPAYPMFGDGKTRLQPAYADDVAAAIAFLTSWLPTVLTANGVPLGHAVVAGSLIQGGGALGTLIVGRLLDRVGIIALVATYILSIPFVVLIGAFPMPESLLMTVVFISGLFLIGGQTGLNALAGTIYPTFVRSTGAGWALGIGRIGSILGPVIGGVLIGMKLSMPTLFVCAAIPGACCAVAMLALRKAMPKTSGTVGINLAAGRC